ncbi:hypothetical protein CAAN1_14S02828 [[Candida] anglica]|uniref:C3H1-type domain-containing protein n=1 Tax=[Candida] anglica TaxID=148631 RepID=A0ABP0EIK7_9ASCO
MYHYTGNLIAQQQQQFPTVRFGKFKGYCDQRKLNCHRKGCHGCDYCKNLPYASSLLRIYQENIWDYPHVVKHETIRESKQKRIVEDWDVELNSLLNEILTTDHNLNDDEYFEQHKLQIPPSPKSQLSSISYIFGLNRHSTNFKFGKRFRKLKTQPNIHSSTPPRISSRSQISENRAVCI